MSLEEHSWKAVSGTRVSPRERACFRALAGDRSACIHPDILFLEVDGRPVSAILSLTHKRCYYLFVTFFDERLRDLQPGRPVIREALRYAFGREEIDEISFVGSYSSATSWSQQVREYRKVRIYGPGLRARLARTVERWETPTETKNGGGV